MPPVDVLRAAAAAILLEISNIPNLQILPNAKNRKLKATTPAAIPAKFWFLSKYMVSSNDLEDFTRPITGNKSRVLNMVVHVGFDENIDTILPGNTIGMAHNGLLTERKCLQVTHPKKGLLIAICHNATDLKHMQEHTQCCLNEAIFKTISEDSTISQVKKGIFQFGDYKVPVDLNYPPNNFERFRKGTKIKYGAKNKMMFNVEYSMESEENIMKSTEKFKLRQNLPP